MLCVNLIQCVLWKHLRLSDTIHLSNRYCQMGWKGLVKDCSFSLQEHSNGLVFDDLKSSGISLGSGTVSDNGD